MYGLSFDKINVIIACCEDIYGRQCIKKKGDNDHFHLQVVSIAFNINSCLFSVVKNKQTRLVCPLRNHVTSLLSHHALRACKDGKYRR